MANVPSIVTSDDAAGLRIPAWVHRSPTYGWPPFRAGLPPGPARETRRAWDDAAVLHAVAAFLPFAALLALTPGPATAMVIHSAACGGRSYAIRATLGNATGLGLWAAASMLGVSALVVASETAYGALKLCGACVLIAYGLGAVRAARRDAGEPAARPGEPRAQRPAMRVGLLTALSNPKVALFYVALLPQFVPADQPLLPATLLLAAIQIVLSCAWYAVLAAAVGRAHAAFARRRAQIQALTGAAMVGFGLKVLADGR
jgi:threonine/homoserine/homoserine lactone efflux protein